MKVFIDTNILIDFVCDRAGFAEEADKLFALGFMGENQSHDLRFIIRDGNVCRSQIQLP